MTDETDARPRTDEGPVPDGGTESLPRRVRRLARQAFQDPSETDDRLLRLDSVDRSVIERHGLANRLTHWLQAVLFVVLLWTGLAIWSGNYFLLGGGIWDGYYVAFGLHMWAGILVLGVTFVLFPFYYVVVDDHRQFVELADVQVGAAISAAFVGLRDYLPYYHEARRAYDADRGDWIAHHPMQKTFFWWIAIFLGLLAMTGFGMYRVMTPDPPGWIVAFGFVETWFAFETLKQVHLLLAFVTASMVAFHVYFAVLPSNWDILVSMVTGDLRSYVVNRDHSSDDAGRERTDDDRRRPDGQESGETRDD